MRLSWSCFSFLPSANTLRPPIIAFSKLCLGGDRYFNLRNSILLSKLLTVESFKRIHVLNSFFSRSVLLLVYFKLTLQAGDFLQPRLYVGRGMQETQLSQFKYASGEISTVFLSLITSFLFSAVLNIFSTFFVV